MQGVGTHAACFVKHKGQLWLLDGAEDCAWNMSESIEESKNWLVDIHYITVFIVDEVLLSKAATTALVPVFERVYRGEPASLRGGNKRKPMRARD